MNRRGFLSAILAAGAAPAIVRAESLMKIFVPPERKIIQPIGIERYYDVGADFDGDTIPLHFGNMVWRPELAMMMPISRVEGREQPIIVQPRRKFVGFGDMPLNMKLFE